MERLHKRFRRSDGSLDIRRILQNTLGLGAALILFSLILVTCVDVVGRYLFSAPLRGAFEMTELLLAALVFSALPLTTERKEHIEVDLINVVLGPKGLRFVTAFAGLFSAALLMTLSWRLAVHALSAAHDGSVTNALNIPLAPFAYLAAFSCFVSAMIAILHALQPTPTHVTGDDHV
jgi:TRAP-type C4-dicarboxylate transport system permease small subunit